MQASAQFKLRISRMLWWICGVSGAVTAGLALSLALLGRISLSTAAMLALPVIVVLVSAIGYAVHRISTTLEAAAGVVKKAATQLRTGEDGHLIKISGDLAEFAYALNLYARSQLSHRLDLESELHFYASFLKYNPVPILVSDRDGYIQHINNSACHFFDRDSTTLTGANLETLFGSSDMDIIRNHAASSESSSHAFISSLSGPSGVPRVVELHLSSLHNVKERPEQFIIALNDITAVMESQNEILDGQTALTVANQELLQKTSDLEAAIKLNNQNARKLGILIRLSYEAARCSSASEVMETLIEGGRRILNSLESYVFIHDRKTNSLKPFRCSIEERQQVLQPIRPGEGILWKTFEENKPYLLGGETVSSEDLALLGQAGEHLLSFVSVPISDEGFNYGIAAFLRPENSHPYSIEELHLINTLANQAAVTLARIHLERMLRQKAKRLQAANEQLTSSRKQIVQLQKMESLGTLVGGIAHDFNNILGIITPNIDLLKMAAIKDAGLMKRITVIEEASERAASLTRQLLMFSRNQDVRLEPLAPNLFVERVVNMLRRALGKHIQIETRLEPGIANIQADETRLTQVLMNLALNARDAMPEGGTITFLTAMDEITPPGQQSGVFVRFSVMDTGTGIDESHLDRIFDPFFTTKAMGKGTGVGLSVVYGIVKSHRGYIIVESEPAKGTTFHIYFPPTHDRVAEPQVEETPFEVAAPPGATVLVVDDEELIRSSLRSSLELLGYQVHLATGGREAINLMKSGIGAHIAIVDLAMPGMNGIETIRAMRQVHPSLKVLLSSGYSEPEGLRDGGEAVDGFLPKPFHVRDLARILGKALSGIEV